MCPGFPEITWDISRMERDVFRGQFGDPEEMLFSELTEYPGNDKWGHLDKAKVLRFINLANVPATRLDWRNNGIGFIPMRLIDIPSIAVVVATGPTTGAAFPVDGNHRIMAREQLGYKSYTRFVVPSDREGDYRIQLEEIQP
jgi:hypothetical protein